MSFKIIPNYNFISSFLSIAQVTTIIFCCFSVLWNWTKAQDKQTGIYDKVNKQFVTSIPLAICIPATRWERKHISSITSSSESVSWGNIYSSDSQIAAGESCDGSPNADSSCWQVALRVRPDALILTHDAMLSTSHYSSQLQSSRSFEFETRNTKILHSLIKFSSRILLASALRLSQCWF